MAVACIHDPVFDASAAPQKRRKFRTLSAAIGSWRAPGPSDGAFTGVQQTWSNCQDTTGTIRVLVVNPPTRAYTLVLSVQTGSPADDAAYQHILDTFGVEHVLQLGLPE